MSHARQRKRWRDRKASKAQLRALWYLGGRARKGMTQGEAADQIDALKRKRAEERGR
jgi:hypothetical protein